MEGHLFYFKYVQVIDYSLEDESCQKENDTIFLWTGTWDFKCITHEKWKFWNHIPFKEMAVHEEEWVITSNATVLQL